MLKRLLKKNKQYDEMDDYHSFYELLLQINKEGKKEHVIPAELIPKAYIEKLRADGFIVKEFEEFTDFCYNNKPIFKVMIKISWK